MSYQEVLIKSSIISAEKMSRIIQKKMDPMYIDSANTVATLRNDFSSDKMIMFGQTVDTDRLAFKAGEQFLVVCGEREAVQAAKLSVHKQLEKNKAAIDGKNQNMEPGEREKSQHDRDFQGR